MANFDPAYQRTLGFEGKVLEDVSGDPGGETFCGISRNNFPNWPGWAIIDGHVKAAGGDMNAAKAAIGADASLPPLVKSFYQVTFWDAMHLGDLASQPTAEEIFDTAVNCGTQQAATIVQRSINVLNNQGLYWPDLAVDGHMGAVTAQTVNQCTGHNPDYERQLLKLLNALQAAYYTTIAEKKPTLEKFMYGWLRQRVVD